MAEVELVIKIDEDTYKDIKKGQSIFFYSKGCIRKWLDSEALDAE